MIYKKLKKDITQKGITGPYKAGRNITIDPDLTINATGGGGPTDPQVETNKQDIAQLKTYTQETRRLTDEVRGWDRDNVKLTANQDIRGNKTFINNIKVQGEATFGQQINAGLGGGTVKVVPEDASTKVLQFYHDNTRKFNVHFGLKSNLTGIKDPGAPDHAANKAYVDTKYDASVKLTTDQSIAGVKTFTSKSKINVDPTDPEGITNKRYVDTQLQAKANANQVVDLTSRQIISGEKNFTTLPKSGVIPTANEHLVNKAYVDSKASSSGITIRTFTQTIPINQYAGTFLGYITPTELSKIINVIIIRKYPAQSYQCINGDIRATVDFYLRGHQIEVKCTNYADPGGGSTGVYNDFEIKLVMQK